MARNGQPAAEARLEPTELGPQGNTLDCARLEDRVRSRALLGGGSSRLLEREKEKCNELNRSENNEDE
jgi:hypothetical protein